MLQLNGKCLGRRAEIIPAGPNNAAFESVTARVQSGHAFDSQITDVRFGRDFPANQLPNEGEDVSLNVIVSAFNSKNGAGYRLTALSRNDLGKRGAA